MRTGNTHRTAVIAPDGGEAESVGERRSGTGRGTARDSFQVPRIVSRSEGAGGSSAGKSELIQIQLPEEHCSRLPNAPSHLCIFGRYTSREKLGSGRRQNTS